MDYAKNFKTKNIILRIIAFVIYFFAAGFIGKLCVILLEPLFSLFLKPFPEAENIILYIISLIFMFAALSFFSMREGYNDTELLRFSYNKTVASYIISGVVFYIFVLCTVILYGQGVFFKTIAEYFFFPLFVPAELSAEIDNIVFVPGIPVLYNMAENIKYVLLTQRGSPAVAIFSGVILSMAFYKTGRKYWISQKKKKAKKYKKTH